MAPARGTADEASAAARRRADRLIALIDRSLNRAVNAILHHPGFQALEARWRGLSYLVGAAQGGGRAGAQGSGPVVVKVLAVSWRELARDFERAVDFDQSHLFELVYAREFGMPGGEPFGLLLGDYAVGHRVDPAARTDDVATLQGVAGVAAAAFAPFLAGLKPAALALDGFADLDGLPNLAAVFDGPDFVRWKSLRETEDCRFVGLLAPRVLMRTPHRAHHRPGSTASRSRRRCGRTGRPCSGAARSTPSPGWCCGPSRPRAGSPTCAACPRTRRAAASWPTCRP